MDSVVVTFTVLAFLQSQTAIVFSVLAWREAKRPIISQAPTWEVEQSPEELSEEELSDLKDRLAKAAQGRSGGSFQENRVELERMWG